MLVGDKDMPDLTKATSLVGVQEVARNLRDIAISQI
jgi:hypothetical protein